METVRSLLGGAMAAKRKPTAELPEAPAQMISFRMPAQMLAELRGAARALDAEQALILRLAVEHELVRLRRKYNRGKPFPAEPASRKPKRTTL